MSDDDWVKAAMEDDDLVVDVMFKLLHYSPPPPPPPPPKPAKRDKSAPPLGWHVRQPRSRSQMVLPVPAKQSPTTRASPTTPLSWSGATSISGGVATADGVEESSRPTPNRSDILRSKAMQTSEATPTKRPRKKKKLAELKDEETTLMEERQCLKRQLAALQDACEQQRKENEILENKILIKKLKVDMQSQQQMEVVASDGAQKTLVAAGAGKCEKKVINNNEVVDTYVLPDLNIPAGGDDIDN